MILKMTTDSNESIESKGQGNTISCPQAKHWCFTLNNYSENDIIDILEVLVNLACRWVFQEEVSGTGTPHLQGFFSFKKRDRTTKFNNKRIHWEISRDRANSYRKAMYYCYNQDKRKPDGRVWHKNVTMIEKLNIPRLEELYIWQKKILNDFILKPIDDREIWWIYERRGGTGKTTFCKFLNYHYGFIPLNGKGADMRNGIVNYEEKFGVLPENIIINIPATFDTNYLSYEGIESVKDMFFYSSKYVGSAVVGNSPRLIIFANVSIDWDKFSPDRTIKCYEIMGSELERRTRPVNRFESG